MKHDRANSEKGLESNEKEQSKQEKNRMNWIKMKYLKFWMKTKDVKSSFGA